MKKWMMVLLAALLLMGCAAAESYVPLDPDPAEAISFDGREVTWAGETFTLGEDVYFLDWRLTEEQIAGNPYAFRDVNDALRALKDGTSEKPMTLLIAPGVYWVENPGPAAGTERLWYAERAIHVDCDHLTLYGLNHDPANVVLGIEHQRVQDDYCSYARFGMFVVDGVGLRCENLTIGSYGTLALDYALAPELSREKQITDANLQQMLFSTGADGIAVNCCFEGHMSLYWFAEYYKDCRMQKGCRVENGACVGCKIEMCDRYLGGADLFGCEVLFDPAVEKAYYWDKDGEQYWYLLQNRYNDGDELTRIGRLQRVDIGVSRVVWDLERWFWAGAQTLSEDKMRGFNELTYQKMLGSRAEMGLTAELVIESYVDPMQQKTYEEKIAAMQSQIDVAKNPAVKKQLQKKLDQVISERPLTYYDAWVEPEYKMGETGVSLTLEQIEHIQKWEVQNEGRRVLLPLVDSSLPSSSWYRLDGFDNPLLDEAGYLVDAYRRDENGDLMWYDPLKEVQWLRLGKYNYFWYLYGVKPETMFNRIPGASQYMVDVTFVLGDEMKSIPEAYDVQIVNNTDGAYYPNWWGEENAWLWELNTTLDGNAHDVVDMYQELHPSMTADQAAAIRIQQGDEILYDFMFIYGEDPFVVAE